MKFYSQLGLTVTKLFALFLLLLPTLAVSGVIEHIELDKGLDMIDKAGVGEKMNKSEMT